MHDNLAYLYSRGWQQTGGKGGQLTGKCPHRDHDDKHPSFSISEVTGAFRCFSCGFKGQAPTTLMMGVEGISYEQARERAYGATISLEPTRRDAYHALMDDCQKWFHAALRATKEPLATTAKTANNYLKQRGVDCESYEVGLSTGLIVKYISKQGHFDALRQTPMLSEEGTYICGDRVTVPITKDNRVIGFSMRSLDKAAKSHKYLNLIDTELYPYHKWLFNLDKHTGDTVRVTEGVFDAMAVGGVALLGTNLSPERISLLHRYKTIYLLFDNDAGGWKAVEDFYFMSRAVLPHSIVKVCDLPRDPDECRENIGLYEKDACCIAQWLARKASRVRPLGAMVNEVKRLKSRADDCYDLDDVERIMLNELLVVECAMSLFAPKLYGGEKEWSAAWSEMCRIVEKETGVSFFSGVRVGTDCSTVIGEQVGSDTTTTGDNSSSPMSDPDTLDNGGNQ
jgi:DNA primase catalytic core